MSKNIMLIALLCLLFACRGNLKKVSEKSSMTTKTVVDSIKYPSEGDTLQLNFHNATAKLSIHKKERKRINVRFFSGEYTKMTGKIIPEDSIANIRFNQIVLPDGTMDGPFGREIEYDLPIKGGYVLIIGESLMAGDPWTGDFEVAISMSE